MHFFVLLAATITLSPGLVFFFSAIFFFPSGPYCSCSSHILSRLLFSDPVFLLVGSLIFRVPPVRQGKGPQAPPPPFMNFLSGLFFETDEELPDHSANVRVYGFSYQNGFTLFSYPHSST